MTRPPLPPFTDETARAKVRAAEDAWNTRDPGKVALAYTPDSEWRNRAEFLKGRGETEAFLTRKWARELDYRLIKELWAFGENRIAVRFAYEWRDDAGNWFRAYGNENWEFAADGLMRRRIASINDLPIIEVERKFRWPHARGPTSIPACRTLAFRLPGSMETQMPRAFAEIAFTPAVRAVQERMGSAAGYARFLAPGAERGDRLGEAEAAFIAARDGFYQATVSETGWPYVQFRGGPRGFLRALDERTIAYADFRGNRQYVSVGNLTADDRVSLILVDYLNRRRLKLFGHARVVEQDEDPALIEALQDATYRARPERAVVITVAGFDWNCPQHIPERFTVEEFEAALVPMRAELDRLRTENAALKAWLGETTDPQAPAPAG